MARRKRQHKPKGPAPKTPVEQRAGIPATDDLIALSGDQSYFINNVGGVSLGIGGSSISAHDVAGIPAAALCLQTIAGDCAKLPLKVKERAANNLDFTPVPANQYGQRLIDPWGRPNDHDTQFDLFYDWYYDACLWPASFLWIDRMGAMPIGLYRLLPDRTWRVKRGGRSYVVTKVYDDASGEYVSQVLPDVDVMVLENTTVGEEKCGPITLFRKTWKTAIATVDWASRYFSQGTQAGGILMVPPGASEPAIKNVETAIRDRANAENWFRTLVLKDNFRWQSTTSDLKNANTAELDEQSARSVARIFKMPVSKLGIRDSMSYNSREADRQEYLDNCLSSWLIQGRSQCHRKLLLPSDQETHIVDYEVDEVALLNMDARSTLVNNAIDRGWMDVHEARRIMKLPPLTPEQRAALAANRPTAPAAPINSNRINGSPALN